MANLYEPEHGIERVRVELSTRHILVMIHGLMLFEVGLVMILTGAPGFFSEWFGDGARLYLGLGAAIPGALLVVGSILGDYCRPGWYLEVYGLLGLVGWHGTMAVLYLIYAVQQGIPILTINEMAPPGAARLYIPLVYLNLLALGVVHIVALGRFGRPPR